MEKVTVTLQDGKRKQVCTGTSLLSLSLEVEPNLKYAPLIASVDGKLKELSATIDDKCKVEFFDLTHIEGNKVYRRGLLFVLAHAVKDLYGNKTAIRVRNSFDKGIYIEFSNMLVTNEVAKAVKKRMQEIIASNAYFRMVNVDRIDAMKHYESLGRIDKVNALRFSTNTFIRLYRLNDMYDFFFGMMPPSTGVLNTFAINKVDEKGIILRTPTAYYPDEIPAYNFKPKMYAEIDKIHKHTKKMGLCNASDLNRYVSEKNINELIRVSEAYQNDELFDIGKLIADKGKVRVVLVAGPSSSGKTTTSKKLANFLSVFGITTHAIGLDDYFHNRDKVLSNGKDFKEFEKVTAVDVELFNKHMKQLIEGKEVTIPEYNFITGMREFKKRVLKIGPKDIIIVEGLHALNDTVLSDLNKNEKFKIYISPLTQLNIDDHNPVSLTDIRLMRRMIRDRHHRGYKIADTIKAWHGVRDGEEKYVFPYQNSGDVVLNTSLLYEMCILRTYVEAYLYDVTEDMPEYQEAKRLLNVLKNFLPIPSDAVPPDSILREFIGGSCYE